MDRLEVNPDKITRADIVVGIPSYNEADSIAFVIKQVNNGLKEHFKSEDSVIINCDNDSTDDTKGAFLNTPTDVPKIYLSTPPGVRGKGNNFANLFQKVAELDAKALVVVDADLKSITPKWIKCLGEPLLSEYGYVTPIYIRHKYDGTITNNIAYPMSRTLFGRRLRQPIGGDFGVSGEMVKCYLAQGEWPEEVKRFGIDIWMTLLAVNQGVQVCQAFMGCPKIHKAKDPAATLGPMFKDVIGTLFHMMVKYSARWKDIVWSKPTPIFGFGLGDNDMPPPVHVDEEKLYANFRKGFDDWAELWESILSKDVWRKLHEVKDLSRRNFEMPDILWANILFDFAVGYKEETFPRERILESLIPLYFGRTRSFVRSTRGMEIRQAEEFIEDQCLVFEETKSYLVERWFGEGNGG